MFTHDVNLDAIVRRGKQESAGRLRPAPKLLFTLI